MYELCDDVSRYRDYGQEVGCMSKVLMKGNEAIAQAAIAAGCNAFFGYPITPQNELIEYMSKYMPDKGAFVQAESELAAINMVYGASAAGARAMTSSSSPGLALKQEGISYCAGAELPAVIVSVSRGALVWVEFYRHKGTIIKPRVVEAMGTIKSSS